MLNFYDFIQVFVFTTNHHLKITYKYQNIEVVQLYETYGKRRNAIRSFAIPSSLTL